jgi:hypothetical protein
MLSIELNYFGCGTLTHYKSNSNTLKTNLVVLIIFNGIKTQQKEKLGGKIQFLKKKFYYSTVLVYKKSEFNKK